MEPGRSSFAQPTPTRSVRTGSRLLVLAAACLFVGSACAPEEQTEYTQDTNTNFFAACSDPVTDTQLHVELCQCVYKSLWVTISYQKLKVLDEELVTDPELPMQPEFVAIMASCVVETLEQLS